MKLFKPVLALLLMWLLAGCSTFGDSDESPAAEGQGSGGEYGANTSGYGDGSSISGSETQGLGGESASLGGSFDDPQSPLSKRTIYFMYDSSQVQDAFIPVISAHAQYLLAHPQQRVTLEGHADERGSREYNIALGEQRAKAVARMLEVEGVSPGQLEIVSYGEEKPAAYEHDEAAWQRNRRVELVYQVN